MYYTLTLNEPMCIIPILQFPIITDDVQFYDRWDSPPLMPWPLYLDPKNIGDSLLKTASIHWMRMYNMWIWNRTDMFHVKSSSYFFCSKNGQVPGPASMAVWQHHGLKICSSSMLFLIKTDKIQLQMWKCLKNLYNSWNLNEHMKIRIVLHWTTLFLGHQIPNNWWNQFL